jgi:hypothetical protein
VYIDGRWRWCCGCTARLGTFTARYQRAGPTADTRTPDTGLRTAASGTHKSVQWQAPQPRVLRHPRRHYVQDAFGIPVKDTGAYDTSKTGIAKTCRQDLPRQVRPSQSLWMQVMWEGTSRLPRAGLCAHLPGCLTPPC